MSWNLRPITANDIEDVFALVRANIEYDGNLHLFVGSPEALAEHLLQHSYAEVVIAEQHQQAVGLALFCTNYSTFLTKPGLFVEDLFVRPEYRGQGIGRSLLAYLAQQVLNRNYGRLEWCVRTWNQRAIEFYQRQGAVILPDWRVCQLYRDAIEQLAA
ncbi:GNAT family N-acetyltransferase [Leptolyngbya sp. NK1-12]|uniref:GNAT family N-acetyltransferase n=1 Tax=Leptolyngbya sp. NK1-12 TaxID=2547451 RepID=A0AA97AJ94_9CYAN|nr:GNAT family N-acetyltransferase [Leptolyngbya sp. NK1-12]